MTNNKEALPRTTDVLVIGYGPVGAALCALLGRYGVTTLVVDKVAEVMLSPRAIALDNEALRILQMAGLGEDAFERIAIPEVKMHCPYLGEFGRANTSGTIDGHPKLVTFYQPDLERALRRQVAAYPDVTFRDGYELVDLSQSDAGVTAHLKDRDGRRHEVTARYLVGADGASSTVRGLIGQDFQGETYPEDWLIVDAKAREGKAIDHVEFLCNTARPTPHMPAPGGRERWEFMLQPGETQEDMERPEKVAELLAPWIAPEDLVVERKAVYRFHARCCTTFQQGRVFLAGDAAHITPPFVGQGLVAGLRDVANLGWKLAWVVNGRATPALLDSYDRERRPHAKKMIGLAKLMGSLVMPRSRFKAITVHGAMRLGRLVPRLRRQLEELEIKPPNRFRDGFLIKGRGRKGVTRGATLAQGLVRQDGQIRPSDDVLGDRFTLIGFGVDPRQSLDDATRTRWQAHGGAFLQIGLRGQHPANLTPFAEDLSDSLANGPSRGTLVVCRPDRVILHDGPTRHANRLVDECLQALTAASISSQ
ncbi:putative flavoprotein monooxygenase [Alcanivorax sp. 521-1]|uniref:Flavoprotein monooxygenase n=1 Tax=Alloalcanivorax profundimaris TaxID=2735259 RepID=A0ABS0AUC7_9GAMM|nr:bifunctional 3-(3-hydroxy-phenyl)propionate/3-hydroxycinnamic acid hydroxylase [Alloalcanivorax profundimaris]MBF5057753.1 putative flavoprotein monooxygenase [Alloalcanivorax profundimaris]